MKNIEIEIKIPIDEPTFIHCKELLNRTAKHLGDSTQIDEYFTPAHKNFLSPEYPFEWLSLRQRGGKCILNYKHWHPENAPTSTHCDEYEVAISGVEQLHLIFAAIGVRRLITVNKMRCLYDCEGTFEIALDSIDGLGHFIEIEYKGSSSNIADANAEIRRLALLLKVDPERKDNRGYPYLMLEKAGLLKGTI